MKPDILTQHDVANELRCDINVSSPDISVIVVDGIVTLRGNVPNLAEKFIVEKIVWKVNGVRAIANEMEVKVMEAYERSDADIARAAVNALAWNYSMPNDLKVTVTKGWVTLSGRIALDFQKLEARTIVGSLMGVLGVTDNISIQKTIEPTRIQTTIEDTLKRSIERESRNIHVSVIGGHVTLSGKVESFSELQQARRVAWNAPGVLMVENNLKVA